VFNLRVLGGILYWCISVFGLFDLMTFQRVTCCTPNCWYVTPRCGIDLRPFDPLSPTEYNDD